MNKKYAYAFAGLLLAMTACSNEDLTAPAESPVAGKTVFVSLTVDRSKGNTRTSIEEMDVIDGVGLSNVWATDDQVTLVAADGKVAGTLTLQGEGGSSEGVFSGEATVADGEYTVWYLGDARNGDPYASFNENSEFVNTLATADCSVTGDFSDLNKGDLMKSTVKIKVIDGKATVTESVTLASQMAMAHFTLSMDGLETALAAEGAELTLSYTVDETPYSYKITNKSADVYVPLFPGTYAPSFTLVSGEKTYTYAFANTTEVEAGVYYCGDKNATTGKSNGISVELAEEAAPEPEEDDLVGPVFEVNGKKFRFTRANLQYNTSTKKYLIPEKQTEYIAKSGRKIGITATASGNPEYIGLFRWGATGIDDNVWKPWPADYWRDQQYYQSTTTINGSLPSQNSSVNATMNTNSTLCPNGLSQDTPYDWGKAYSIQKNDDSHYFTLSMSELTAVIDNNIAVCGTVEGVGGVVILPYRDIEKAKKEIEGVGGTHNALYKLSKTIANTGSNYGVDVTRYAYDRLTLTYDQLTKLNGVFLPASGMNNPSTGAKNSPVVSTDYDDNICHYWTSTVAGTPSAYQFLVDGGEKESNRYFKFMTYGKGYALAVRLVKEVDGPDDETVGNQF